MTHRLLLIAISFAVTSSLAFAQTERRSDRIDRVTLYRGQALVSRIVSLPEKDGAIEIVVPGLPLGIMPESLFAEGGEGAEVRSVRFRTRAVGSDPRDEMRAEDEKIKELERAVAKLVSTRSLLQKRTAMLDRIEQGFLIKGTTADLSRGVLDADQLTKAILFVFEQRAEIEEKTFTLASQETELQAELSLIRRRRDILTSKSTRTVREAVVSIEKRSTGAGTVRLGYLVKGCGWSPSYNFRALTSKSSVIVEYDALVKQATGEDWTNVELILSTATPALNSEGPGLAPYAVSLIARRGNAQQKATAQKQYRQFLVGQNAARLGNTIALAQDSNLDTAWQVNEFANKIQNLELNFGSQVFDPERKVSKSYEGPTLSYRIDGRTSLRSRREQQTVRISRAPLEASLMHVATPVLSRHVYREASMANTSGLDYLNGPVSVWLDGGFVGRAELEMVARGETFVVGLGADPRLRTHREVVSRKERVQGGNRVVDLEVKLTVENFDGGTVPVRLLDRMPFSPDKNGLRVSLEKMSSPLSKDESFLKEHRDQGILQWETKVPGQSTRAKALSVVYNFRLEYDRNLILSTVGGQTQEEIKEAFRNRSMKRGRK